MFRKILVPTDFSDAAQAALKLACELAHPLGTVVELLHVCQLPRMIFPDGNVLVVPPLEAAGVVRRASVALKTLKREADPRALVTTRLMEGTPVDAILGAVGENDLIVMGTHGRKGISHLFLGSVAEGVMRRASCPVLTVRSAAPAAVQAPDAGSARSAG